MLIMTPNPVNSDQIWSMMENVDGKGTLYMEL